MALNAGDMDREIVIQSPTASAGGSGFPVDTWAPLTADPIWAFRIDVGGRERFVSNQLSAPFDCRWQIYYRDDMDPELVDVPKLRRLLYQNRIYDIVAAVQMERQEGIELLTLASSKVSS